jgi:3-hydroxy-9,10-secoandrosta-1,3,5(10)-triene-9,17-dione monooxygenase reductase component
MNSSPNTTSTEFRGALGRFATGVTIVTTKDGSGNDVGLTANSFSSVSLDPPMVLWSLSRQSLSLPAFVQASYFAVHVLAANQDELAKRFAIRGIDKFAGLQIGRGPGAIPLLADCSARFQCRKAYEYDGGDHVIFVGEVITFDHSDRAPLVFHGGRYAVAAARADGEQTSHATAPAAGSQFTDDILLHQLGRAYHQLLLRLHDHLNQHGLASFNPAAPHSLSGQGRQAVIELVAAAKAGEADAEHDLGVEETRLLKQWLARITSDSEPGP